MCRDQGSDSLYPVHHPRVNQCAEPSRHRSLSCALPDYESFLDPPFTVCAVEPIGTVSCVMPYPGIDPCSPCDLACTKFLAHGNPPLCLSFPGKQDNYTMRTAGVVSFEVRGVCLPRVQFGGIIQSARESPLSDSEGGARQARALAATETPGHGRNLHSPNVSRER